MDIHGETPKVLNGNPVSNSLGEASRRGFLGGLGTIGLGAMLSAFGSRDAEASTAGPGMPPKLSSVGKVNVTRDETFDVPGGKEYFVEWTASDGNGVVQKFMAHHSRVDAEKTYTMSSDVVIHTFAPGADLNGKPQGTKEQHITTFAVKGDVAGSIRNDEVTVTTVHTDGSVTRQTQTVPVRLDVSEFAGMDTATMITNFGKKFIPSR